MRPVWTPCAVAGILLSSMTAPGARGEEKAPPGEAAAGNVSYYQDVRPVLQAHCLGCHQPAKQGGEYVMTQFSRLLAGGESGDPAIVAGKPDESALIDQITPADGEAAMPKERKPLAAVTIGLIRKWIEQGAQDDTPASAQTKYDSEHPPQYVAPPVVTSLDFSPDGKWLAVSGYHEVVLHHADGSGVAARLIGMSARIESAVFSPDGKRLAVTGGSPGRLGEVQIWNVEQRALELSRTIGYDTLYGASWSGDNKLVGFGCPDNTLRAIDTETGEQKLYSGAHNDWVLDTIFSVKSDHLISVSRDRSMKLIHVSTQRFVDNITSITPGALKGGLHAIDRHPSKDELLCGGADGAPKIYRMVREKARKIGDDFNLIRAFPKMPGRIFSVAFSRDGNRIVVGSSYNTTGEVRVFNYADAKELLKVSIPESAIYAVAFAHDGKQLAASGYDGQIRLIDSTSGEIKHAFPPVPIEPVQVGGAEE